MLDDYKVRVTYKTRESDVMNETEYGLADYCALVGRELKYTLNSIEECINSVSGAKSKSNWNEETQNRFTEIRRLILNQANNIERLPFNLYCCGQNCGQMNLSQFIAQIVE